VAKEIAATTGVTRTQSPAYTAISVPVRSSGFELLGHFNEEDPELPTYELRWGKYNYLTFGVNPEFDAHPSQWGAVDRRAEYEALRTQAADQRVETTHQLIKQIEASRPPMPDDLLLLQQFQDKRERTITNQQYLLTLRQRFSELVFRYGPLNQWPLDIKMDFDRLVLSLKPDYTDALRHLEVDRHQRKFPPTPNGLRRQLRAQEPFILSHVRGPHQQHQFQLLSPQETMRLTAHARRWFKRLQPRPPSPPFSGSSNG